MTPATAARLVVMALGVAVAPAHAQDHAAPPAKSAAPAKAVTAAPAPAPAPAPVVRGPVIAPGKPIVAPRIGPTSDSGAVPMSARSPKTKAVSVSARQAAEQTIAALVAAMKSMPKRPPAPPEPRTASARRAAAASREASVAAPPRINYQVSWPSKSEEPGLDTRVELAWPGPPAGGVALRWNEPAQ